MAHYCICPQCNIKFDRDKEQAVKLSGRRYGHAACYPENTDFVPLVIKVKEEKNPDLAALNDYIYQLFGDNTNWAMIKKQIKKYVEEEGYTISGIHGSLVYFYEVKRGDKSKANNSIGIVPYIYAEARNYYGGIQTAQQANENKTFITKVKEFIIKTPKMRGTRNQLLDWDLEDEDDEEE